jgi:tetratricopeptide (TPR) repeat protein
MMRNVGTARANAKRKHAMQRLASGDIAGAVLAFQELLDASPDDAAAWDDIGWAVKESHPAEALRYFERALAIDPRHVNAWIGRGMAVSTGPGEGGDHEALRCFEQALAIDAACANAWFLKSVVLYELGRADDAAEARRRASHLDPAMFGKVR